MALNGLILAEVRLRFYSLTQSSCFLTSGEHGILLVTLCIKFILLYLFPDSVFAFLLLLLICIGYGITRNLSVKFVIYVICWNFEILV